MTAGHIDDRVTVGHITPLLPHCAARLSQEQPAGAASGHVTVGSPGKLGVIELTFAPGGLVHRFAKAPQSLGRLLHHDPCTNAHVAIVRSTGGGLSQYDRIRQDFSVLPGAHAIVTTQAATKVHRMDANLATQQTRLVVDEGAILEYVPDAVIPFAGSRFHQTTTATVTRGGLLVAGDVFAAGRLSRHERNDMDLMSLHTRLDIVEPDTKLSRPLFVERGDFGKLAGASLSHPLNSAEAGAWGSLFVVTPTPAQAKNILDTWHAQCASYDETSTCYAGASSLPVGAGVWARFVADTVQRAYDMRHELWSCARQIVLGHPAPDLRTNMGC